MSVNVTDPKELEIQFEDLKRRITELEAEVDTLTTDLTSLTARVVTLETWYATGLASDTAHKISSDDVWTAKDLTITKGLITAIET